MSYTYFKPVNLTIMYNVTNGYVMCEVNYGGNWNSSTELILM